MAVLLAPAQSATPPRNLWIGDSIIESYGLTTKLPTVTANRLGWAAPINKAQGGTGYDTAGKVAGRQSISARIGAVLDANPDLDVLVIEGGYNDYPMKTTFREAVRRTYATAKDKTGPYGTRVVVLGIYTPSGSGGSGINTVLKEEAAAAGLTFVDWYGEGWTKGFASAGRLNADGVHPNQSGADFLGRMLAGAFALHGLPRG